jgi:hypothetical protein
VNNQVPQDFALIGETSSFTRIPHKDGELLEIKVHVRSRTPIGVSHENIQTVVLGHREGATIVAGLKMLHGQVQAIVAAEVARQAEMPVTEPDLDSEAPQKDQPSND